MLALLVSASACSEDSAPGGDSGTDSALPDMSTGDAGVDSSTGDTATGTPDSGASDTLAPDTTTDTRSPDSGTGVACSGEVGPRERELSVESGGRARTFQVHIPPAYDGTTPLPVVLNYHGRTNTSSQQRRLSEMDATADSEGFIVVYPDGVGETWNAGLCCGESMTRDIDDVAFTSAMIDALEGALCMNNRRVYATGLSNGGFMAHKLACELSDRIAAIAPVAGTNLTTGCSPSRPVPVLHFHGDADLIVPYRGFGGFVSVDDTMDGWVERNGCSAGSSEDLDRGDALCESWSGCTDGATVRLCTIRGGGHQWPGGVTIPGLGSNTSDISATEMMWQFFSMHSL